ncbi:MAG: biopolymer transporter ExbD [Lentisphaeria bacterium]|nr:biopolymer transporter ExbD [Victivallales bacterium]MBR6058900.1 biopolymer transporter ExbD [Victivallales bacterium]MCR4574029.1 biopolymer transporter ExbD [Lentisphaeria bacterium]
MRRNSEETLETPITQMIDIVFLLIIFFVVTASVDKDLVDETINLAQAKNTNAETAAKKLSVTINMKMAKDSQGRSILVGGRPKVLYNIALQEKSLDGIRQALQAVKNDTGTIVPILIRVDKNVEYRYIDELLSKAVARVGFTKVSIVAVGNE